MTDKQMLCHKNNETETSDGHFESVIKNIIHNCITKLPLTSVDKKHRHDIMLVINYTFFNKDRTTAVPTYEIVSCHTCAYSIFEDLE